MSSRRDYKLSKTGHRRRQRARHQGLLVLTLILIGLFGGLLTYIRGDRIPPPVTAAAPAAPTLSAAPTAPTAPTPPAAPTLSAAPTAPTSPAIVAPAIVAPSAAVPVVEPEPVKPKYDFYTELPKRQIDVQSGVAPSGASPSRPPTRTQPAVNQLQKPAPPRKNATPATLAAASNGKTAKARPVTAKTAAAEPASNGKTAKVKPANVGTAAAESARSKPASARPVAAPPTPRPLANSGSKIAVKTE